METCQVVSSDDEDILAGGTHGKEGSYVSLAPEARSGPTESEQKPPQARFARGSAG